MPPPLQAAIAEPCPPLRRLTSDTFAELIASYAEAALDYARCQARHGAAVGAYEDARNAEIEANTGDPATN